MYEVLVSEILTYGPKTNVTNKSSILGSYKVSLNKDRREYKFDIYEAYLELSSVKDNVDVLSAIQGIDGNASVFRVTNDNPSEIYSRTLFILQPTRSLSNVLTIPSEALSFSSTFDQFLSDIVKNVDVSDKYISLYRSDKIREVIFPRTIIDDDIILKTKRFYGLEGYGVSTTTQTGGNVDAELDVIWLGDVQGPDFIPYQDYNIKMGLITVENRDYIVSVGNGYFKGFVIEWDKNISGASIPLLNDKIFNLFKSNDIYSLPSN